MTIISSLTIGIPAFFLALGPSSRRYVPGFVRRVLHFAGRSGLVAFVATFAVYAYTREIGSVSLVEARTASAITLLVIGLWILVILARPFTSARVVLLAAMGGAFLGGMAVPGLRHFFALEFPPANIAVVIVIAVAVAGIVLEVLARRAASGPEADGLSR